MGEESFHHREGISGVSSPRVVVETTDEGLRTELSRLIGAFLEAESFEVFLGDVIEAVRTGLRPVRCEIVGPDSGSAGPTVRAFRGWHSPREVADRLLAPSDPSSPVRRALSRGEVIVRWAARPPSVEPPNDPSSGADPDRDPVLVVPIHSGGKIQGAIGAHFASDDQLDWARGATPVRFLHDLGQLVLAAWERAHALDEAWNSQAQLGAIFRESADGIYLIRVLPGGGWVYEMGNPALERMTGRTFDHQSPEDILSEEAAALARREIAQVIRTRKPRRTEAEYSLPVGRRRFAVTRNPVVGPGGEVEWIVGIVRDTTEEHLAKERHETALRLESLVRLSGGLSHQLNNALTALVANLELLGSRIRGDAPGREYLAAAAAEARNAAQLVERLARFARQRALPRESFDLCGLVREVADAIPAETRRRVAVEVACEPSPLTIETDRAGLRELLDGLVENALDAMPGRGTLSLRAWIEDLDAEAADGLGVAPRSYAVIEVKDTGRGMSEEVRERIFDPFFTTKEVTSSRGLTLAAGYGQVRGGGGTVEVRSHEGEGTLVRVFHPLVTDLDPTAPGEGLDRAEPGREAPAPPPPFPVRLLLVEDEARVRQTTALLLEQIGFHVHAVPDADEALSWIEGHADSLDLVMTDVVMPGLTGIDLAERLSRRFPHLPVLFTSGYASKDLDRVPGRPPEPFLPKPYTKEELEAAVRDALRSSGSHDADDA